MRDPNELNAAHMAGYAAFAASGGLLGYVLRTLDANQPVSWKRLTVETAASGFMGVMAMLACNALDVNTTWTGVIVGMSGWLGATASMRLIETLVYKRLGITQTDVDVAKEMEHVQHPDNSDR